MVQTVIEDLFYQPDTDVREHLIREGVGSRGEKICLRNIQLKQGQIPIILFFLFVHSGSESTQTVQQTPRPPTNQCDQNRGILTSVSTTFGFGQLIKKAQPARRQSPPLHLQMKKKIDEGRMRMREE